MSKHKTKMKGIGENLVTILLFIIGGTIRPAREKQSLLK